ncbi:MAG: hypothetical protein AVDCRST_MAG05-1502 [uncultured Rubrobacteraceae bacterium]|uniref:Uncharacterized protein n=1 Tax=uncultured Rubrobacteraceae bacterium TaxID=349277 RepID=A0A6J4RXL1_9ACTN|nr:MAG: hypothetical protein AVDCRST_MAG05-1502 [uncultured Rubrobacteraceae bacterium]
MPVISCKATWRSPTRNAKPAPPRSAATTKAGAASSIDDSTVTSPTRLRTASARVVLKRRRTTLACGAKSCSSRAACRLARSALASKPHAEASSTPASRSVSSCSGSPTTSGACVARAARTNVVSRLRANRGHRNTELAQLFEHTHPETVVPHQDDVAARARMPRQARHRTDVSC